MNVNPNWTFDEAWAAQEAFQEKGGGPTDPVGPFHIWGALHHLETDQLLFESGNRFALLRAIRTCAICRLPMPDWVANEYVKAVDRIDSFRALSWDEVLARPIEKGGHRKLRAERKRLEKGVLVWIAVNEARKQGRAVDDELFTEIGRKLGLGRSLAAEYYAQVDQQGPVFARRTRNRRKAR